MNVYLDLMAIVQAILHWLEEQSDISMFDRSFQVETSFASLNAIAVAFPL